jgi:hypothetical protein
MIFSGSSESKTYVSSTISFRNELAPEFVTKKHDAITCIDARLPKPAFISASDLRNPILQLFSNKYFIREYNQKTSLGYIKLQQSVVETAPLLLWKLYNPASSGDRDSLPVLS